MKNNLKFALTLLLMFEVFNASSQSFKTAVSYLDFVGKEQEGITKNMWKYTQAIAHRGERAVGNRRKILIKSVESSIEKIDKAEGYNGDEFKNQVLEHLRFNESLLKNDYAKIIDMKAIAEQSYDAMEAFIMAQEMADQKMKESQELYETHFYAFANKNNVNIIEDESDLSKKMAISGQVFKHYNTLYLIFFKVYMNEVYLMNSLGNNDINGMQQNANALSQSAREGLEQLNSVELYNNDDSIVKATKKAFEFYIDEAENKIPKMVEFLVLNQDFETIKNNIEKTPEKKRTKEQIDAYNDKVKALNKGGKEYNQLNAELNNERSHVIENLNNSNNAFLAKQIPNA